MWARPENDQKDQRDSLSRPCLGWTRKRMSEELMYLAKTMPLYNEDLRRDYTKVYGCDAWDANNMAWDENRVRVLWDHFIRVFSSANVQLIKAMIVNNGQEKKWIEDGKYAWVSEFLIILRVHTVVAGFISYRIVVSRHKKPAIGRSGDVSELIIAHLLFAKAAWGATVGQIRVILHDIQ